MILYKEFYKRFFLPCYVFFMGSVYILTTNLMCRNCIIDKNARIGNNVIIANKEVSNELVVEVLCFLQHFFILKFSFSFIINFFFPSEIGGKMVSLIGD